MDLKLEGQVGRFIGVVLYAVSTIMSIKLLVQFADSGIDQLMFGAVGFGFQTAMAILFIVGFKMAQEKSNGLAAIFFGAWVFLFFLSLTASMGFFISSSAEKTAKSIHGDEKYELMQSQMKKLDSDIEQMQYQMSVYAKKYYYTRGVEKIRPALNQAEKDRQAVYEQIMAYEPVTSNDEFFIAVAKFIGAENPEQIRFIIFFCVAVAVDAIGALLIALSIVSNGFYEENQEQVKAPLRDFKEPVMAHQEDLRPFKDSYKDPLQERPYSTVDVKTSSDTGITPETVTAYVNSLFAGQKPNGALKGRLSIADEIGISNQQAERIHNLLKGRKLLKVDGKKTFPVTSRAKTIERIMADMNGEQADDSIGFLKGKEA